MFYKDVADQPPQTDASVLESQQPASECLQPGLESAQPAPEYQQQEVEDGQQAEKETER